MKTKSVKTTRSVLLLLCHAFISTLLISCGSDDEGVEDNMEETFNEDAALSFTLGSVTYEANFDGDGAAILAVTNPQITWTSVTLGGTSSTGATVSFIIAFQGKQTGMSTVSGAAGEDTNAPEGLSLVIFENTNGTTYEATSININITSYKDISGITAEVAGTFSGTVADEDGNQSSISGAFQTGTF